MPSLGEQNSKEVTRDTGQRKVPGPEPDCQSWTPPKHCGFSQVISQPLGEHPCREPEDATESAEPAHRQGRRERSS